MSAAKHPTDGSDVLARFARGEKPHHPVAELMEYSWTELEPGRAVVEMPVQPKHGNLRGFVQGGVLCVLADSAMGAAHIGYLKEGESHTTLEMKVSFLKPVSGGRLKAVGRVVKPGSTIAYTECEIFDSQGNLVAKGSANFMTLKDQGMVYPENDG